MGHVFPIECWERETERASQRWQRLLCDSPGAAWAAVMRGGFIAKGRDDRSIDDRRSNSFFVCIGGGGGGCLHASPVLLLPCNHQSAILRLRRRLSRMWSRSATTYSQRVKEGQSRERSVAAKKHRRENSWLRS